MTTAQPFRGTKLSHMMKYNRKTRAKNPQPGISVKVDPSIIRKPLTPAEILENERYEGATLRVASKLFWEAKSAGEGKDIDANMAKIARGE